MTKLIALTAWTGFFLFITTSAIGAAQESAAILFQEGLLKENGERDPEAAIPYYEQAGESAPPSLRAEAFLHLGLCQERLGRFDQAMEAYRRVVQMRDREGTEVYQTAQMNLIRLQKERDTAGNNLTAPALQAVPDRRWHVGLDVSRVFTGGQRNPVLWLAVGKTPVDHLELGVEGGYLFPSRFEGLRTQAGYVGPYLEPHLDIGKLILLFRAGGGLFWEQDQWPAPVGETHQRQNLAVPWMVAVRYRVATGIFLGAGLRNLVIFPHTNETSLETRTLIMTFLSIASAF